MSPITPTIEIETAQFDELDAMIGLMSEAFGLPYIAAREVFYADPYFNIENKRVLRVDGRLVACLTIIESACWIGHGVARMGGIAGVATLPSERRHGYAGRLLKDALQTLKQRDYAISALIPFSVDYYRKFGWEMSGLCHRYLTVPAHLPAYPEYAAVRIAHPDDVPELERLYAVAAGRTLHCLRDRKRWRYILDNVKQHLVYAPPGGGPIEGYLLYEPRAAAPAEPAGNGLPSTLRILEMRAATGAARRGLIGYLAHQSGFGCLQFDASWQDLLETDLLHLAGSGEGALASIEPLPAVMTRIIDFGRVVEALRANWTGFEGKIALMLSDAFLGNSAVLVTGTENGTLYRPISSGEAMTSPHRLAGDIRVWSQVAIGHLRGDDACALGLLQPSTPQAAAMAAPLFPQRAPYLPLPDHF